MSLPEESVAANTLPEVTTIPTGKKLIFTDPDTNEGGIITLENLSKQILQNLTSQTFALDQGNLTLLQALNQLNSKIYVYSYSANDKSETIHVQFPANAHMTGIIYIDQNMYMNIYAFGKRSGIKNIIYSSGNIPSLNSDNNIISIYLSEWSTFKLITMDANVKVTL